MGRTIESPANQLRIMNEQWERLTRAVGNVFLPILSKILPYLNAILMVLTEIISVIATFVGYKQDDFDYFTETAGSAWDLDDALTSAGTSAKKLKQGLRGFDKLNVVTTPTSGGGGSASAGGVNPEIMKAFNAAFDEYQNKLKNVKMRATEIRDAIMDWLGFTKEIDEATGDINFKLKEGYSNFKLIVGLITALTGLKLLKSVGGLITGTSKLGKLLGTGGIYGAIKKIISASKVLGAKDGLLYVFYDSKLGKGLTALTSGFGKLAAALGVSTTALLAIIAAIIAVGASFVRAYKTNDEFREKVQNLALTMKETLLPVFETIAEVLKTIWHEILVPLWNEAIKPLALLISDLLVPRFEITISLLQILFDKIIKPMIPILKTIVDTILKNLIKQVNNIIKVIKIVIDTINWLWQNVLTPLIDWLKPILEKVAKWIQENIADTIEKVGTGIKALWDNILSPLANFLKVVVALVIGVVIDRVESLYNAIKIATEWFKDKYDKWIKPIAEEVKKDIGILSDKITSFYDNKIKPIIDKIKTKIQEFKDAWEDVKSKFKLPDLGLPKLPKIKLTVSYSTNVNAAKKAVYKALGLDGWPSLSFSSYAKGGLPQVGQLFIANEKGPELVGQIGGQSFVANQNQMMDLLDKKIGSSATPINATFVIQVGNKEIAKQVITDLQDMAKTNGKPITIGG